MSGVNEILDEVRNVCKNNIRPTNCKASKNAILRRIEKDISETSKNICGILIDFWKKNKENQEVLDEMMDVLENFPMPDTFVEDIQESDYNQSVKQLAKEIMEMMNHHTTVSDGQEVENQEQPQDESEKHEKVEFQMVVDVPDDAMQEVETADNAGPLRVETEAMVPVRFSFHMKKMDSDENVRGLLAGHEEDGFLPMHSMFVDKEETDVELEEYFKRIQDAESVISFLENYRMWQARKCYPTHLTNHAAFRRAKTSRKVTDLDLTKVQESEWANFLRIACICFKRDRKDQKNDDDVETMTQEHIHPTIRVEINKNGENERTTWIGVCARKRFCEGPRDGSDSSLTHSDVAFQKAPTGSCEIHSTTKRVLRDVSGMPICGACQKHFEKMGFAFVEPHDLELVSSYMVEEERFKELKAGEFICDSKIVFPMTVEGFPINDVEFSNLFSHKEGKQFLKRYMQSRGIRPEDLFEQAELERSKKRKPDEAENKTAGSKKTKTR